MSTSFQERFGLPKKSLQVNSIDRKTRIRIWNEMDRKLWPSIYSSSVISGLPETNPSRIYTFDLYTGFLGRDSSNQRFDKYMFIANLKSYLLNDKLPWYDFLEFLEKSLTLYLELIGYFPGHPDYEASNFKEYVISVNKILAEEQCGYRFVGIHLSPVIDQIEIDEIEIALIKTNNIVSVKDHLKSSLMLLSDREMPDYDNSIKESISAVEALCQQIVGDQNATLSNAISKVEKKLALHPVLKLAISKFYAWAGDAPGIRHAGNGVDYQNFDTAKFALVICSGLVNFLIAKCEETSIQLRQ